MAFTDNPQPVSLPDWLQQQARQQGASIALRHKRLGIWHVHTWRQLADEVQNLAVVLLARGFAAGATLVIVSRPRPEALLAALAAQWLGGVAALLDPLDAAEVQVQLLRELNTDFVLAEGLAEIQRLRAAAATPSLLIYADARGMADLRLADNALEYAHLVQQIVQQRAEPLLTPQAQPERTAFAFYRLGVEQRIEQQRISHTELLQEGRRLVHREQLGRQEEALAARAFAAGDRLATCWHRG